MWGLRWWGVCRACGHLTGHQELRELKRDWQERLGPHSTGTWLAKKCPIILTITSSFSSGVWSRGTMTSALVKFCSSFTYDRRRAGSGGSGGGGAVEGKVAGDSLFSLKLGHLWGFPALGHVGPSWSGPWRAQ